MVASKQASKQASINNYLSLLQSLCLKYNVKYLINDYPNSIPYVKLKDVCEMKRGRTISRKYIADNVGQYPVYSSQTLNDGIIGKINSYDYDGNYVTWTTDGAYAGTIFHRKGKFSITTHCAVIKSNNNNLLLTDFIGYFLSINTKKLVKGSSNLMLGIDEISNIEIPLVPIHIQHHIVQTLDKLSSLINQTTGLIPSELTFRTKQYEYYRELLLNFKKEID
ncbi:restriction endonuclease subunit S [Ureaplasma sp. ES3154-GEN]|uniref:restriction endonuclease subunit S n=1 Tax=Ureaplasma sp. ES3154-GEN TaxID=2984844 RepID=UPI0021E7CDBD|nr:restriction endonuclease subunit S [Ureaplasma sp. ES3154-GEN]MCV3743456.1 restriction endonuclease subunit S [Ureaplasma sp. ES3154-GEN]